MATVRKNANLSQAELAQQVSISLQAVGKWERGKEIEKNRFRWKGNYQKGWLIL